MSEEFKKPAIVDQEIILDPNKVIMSKTDKFGVFEFANDYFMEVSGYEEFEIMGKSMFCVQHPDMPEVIFKIMWEKLLAKKNFHVVVKNIAKNGKYYWSITNFTFKINESDGEIIAIYSKRVAANRKSIDFFSKFYKTLLNIEKKSGVLASEKFLIGYLEENLLSFEELVQQFYINFSNSNLFNKETKSSINSKNVSEKQEETIKPIFQITKKTTIKQKPVVENKKTASTKKSLFQKLFGKTEEEIEEERLRKAKNKK